MHKYWNTEEPDHTKDQLIQDSGIYPIDSRQKRKGGKRKCVRLEEWRIHYLSILNLIGVQIMKDSLS